MRWVLTCEPHSRLSINAATVVTGPRAPRGLRAVNEGAKIIDFTTRDTIAQDLADVQYHAGFSQGSCVDWWFPVTVVV